MSHFGWKNCWVVTSMMVATASWAQQTAPVPQSQILSTSANTVDAEKSIETKYHAIRNISDNVKWTSWVAHQPTSTPTITVSFQGTRYLTAVEISPGCAATNATFRAFSRPKTLTIQGGGRRIELQVHDRRSTQRLVVEPPMPTDLITISITDQFSGTHPSVCISELRFEEITLPSHVDRKTFAHIQGRIKALQSPNASAAVEELTAMGPTAIPMLLANLTDHNQGQSLQILQVIRKVGSPIATEQLVAFASRHINSPLTRAAVQALAATKDPRSVAVIGRVLNGTNPEYALMAAHALQHFGPASKTVIGPALKRRKSVELTVALLDSVYISGGNDVFEIVRPYLRNPNVQVRVAATRGLRHPDKAQAPVVRAIRTQMRDGHPSVRHAVGTALNAPINHHYTTALLAELLHDPNAWVAREAINALSNSHGRAGAVVLSEYLKQDNAPFGLIVVEALGSMQPSHSSTALLDLLRRGEIRFRQAARKALAKQGPVGLQTLLDAALTDSSLHRDAAETMTENMDLALPMMVELVQRQPAQLPRFAVETLSASGSDKALHLMDTLWHHRIHRLTIVRGWANFRAASVQSRLANVLNTESDATILRAAVESCGKANAQQLIPQLHDLLKQDLVAHDVIIEVLGSLHDRSIEPYIIQHFVTAPQTDRLAMLNTCHQLATMKCSRLLMNAVTDSDGEIQRQAVRLLNTPMVPTSTVPNVAGIVH